MTQKTLQALATQYGKNARKDRADTLHLHIEYHAEDTTAEHKAEMRYDWQYYHLIGQGYSAKQAETMLAMTRVERNAKNVQLEASVKRASSDFGYHVVESREAGKKVALKPKRSLRLSVEIKEECLYLINMFDGDINKAIQALKQVA
jgi:hypothetical protein